MEVGRIEDFSSGVSLRRSGKPAVVQPLTALLDGDVLELGEAQSRVVLRLGSEMLTVCRPDRRDATCNIRAERYVIQARAAVRPTLAANIRQWLSDWLNSGHETIVFQDAS